MTEEMNLKSTMQDVRKAIQRHMDTIDQVIASPDRGRTGAIDFAMSEIAALNKLLGFKCGPQIRVVVADHEDGLNSNAVAG